MKPGRKGHALTVALMTGSAICSGVVVPQIAVAQQTGGAIESVAPDGTIVLREVVLYGDRTATTLDESNASVAVVTAEPEAAPAPVSVRDALRQVVNVDTGPALESGFSIRGINSEGLVPGALDAPLASFYVDGVQQTINGVRRGVRSFWDVEQMEVYRGPQSTLSGRAALAGAIYMRTVDPEFTASGAARLSYGSDNHRYGAIAYGGPLSDNLAYRVSAEWSKKDSDINYPSLESYKIYDDLTTDEYYTLRGKLLWLPTGDDTTRVIFSYAHSYDRPTASDVAGPNWGTNYGLPAGMGPSYDARRGDLWVGLSPVGIPIHAYMENRNTKVDSFGAEVTHEISESLRFTAVTGVSRSLTDRASINDGMPYGYNIPDLGFGIPVDTFTKGEFTQRTISQEFRLNHEQEGLKWVAGFYAGHSNNDSWRNGDLPDYFDPFTPGDGSDDILYIYSQNTRNSVDITNLALFGEVTWEFAPRWSLIAGGRVDWIEQKQSAYQLNDYTLANALGIPLPSQVETSTDSKFEDTVFLPKIGLQYDLPNAQTIALTYQEGYRPGGAGIRADDGSVFEYDPEFARNVELAWRGSFADDRLTVAANLFWQKWKDQQVEVLLDAANPALGSYITNAARSESYGGELAIAYAATDQLNLFGALGLLQTEFKDFNIPDYGNFDGKSFSNAPETSIVLGLRWTGDTGWFAAASAKYVSSSYSTIEKGVSNPVKLDARTTVDAEVGYGWGNAVLTAYATNLFDEKYFVYESGPDVVATLGDRREVGLRLDYRF